jgi:hypothetical protein
MQRIALACLLAPLSLVACSGGSGNGNTPGPGPADAGPAGTDGAPDAATAACPAPTSTPTFAVLTGVSPVDNAVETIALPDGYSLSGAIAVPGSSLSEEWVEVLHPDTGLTFLGGMANDGYSLAVLPGRYAITYVAAVAVNAKVTVNQRITETVDVCGDRVRDVTFPAVPALEPAKITVHNPQQIGSWGDVGPSLLLRTDDGALEIETSFSTRTTDAMVFDAMVPYGVPLHASLGGYPVADVLLTGDTTLEAPATVTLSGVVHAVDPLLVGESWAQCGPFLGTLGVAEPHAFSFAAAKGFTCPLQVEMTLPYGRLESIAAPQAQAQDVSTTFVVPAVIDSLVQTTFAFTDAHGGALSGSYMFSLSSTHAPKVTAGWRYTVSVQIDPSGSVGGKFPPGTYALGITRGR